MPSEDRLKAKEWEVRTVSLRTVIELVERYHYAAGGSNTAVYRHGLFRVGDIFEGQCVGVSWWIAPTKTACEATFPSNWRGVLALSRLAIKPDVPRNAASFLIARSMALIDRARWPCLVTYADTWRGHSGAIYKATGWDYVGMTKPERTYVKEGRLIARKAGPNTRTHAEMLALGAECVGSFSKHKFVSVRTAAA